MQGQSPFPTGTKVRVRDFPPPAGQAIPFDFNGLVGTVKSSHKVGLGLNAKPVYQYLVEFKEVEVPFSRMNQTTRKLERGSEITGAEQFFEEIFLIKEG